MQCESSFWTKRALCIKCYIENAIHLHYSRYMPVFIVLDLPNLIVYRISCTIKTYSMSVNSGWLCDATIATTGRLRVSALPASTCILSSSINSADLT